MENVLSKECRLAAKLIFVSAFITFISFLLDDQIPKSDVTFSVLLFALALNVGTGLLVLKNVSWIKYVLLIITLLCFVGIILSPATLFRGASPILLIIDLFSIVLQIYILILLFKISK